MSEMGHESLTETSNRHACVLGILRKENPASTKRIIELASSKEFQEICRDCRNGVEVYETAMKIQQAGPISTKPGKGGFVWALREDSENTC